MTQHLQIFAGKQALKTLQEHGWQEQLFTTLLGASGGPKWFVLYGLDKYLSGVFFKDRRDALHVVGSSVGAFRAACYAQTDPVAAIERMAKGYIETCYSSKYVSPKVVTDSVRTMLHKMLGPDGVDNILGHETIKAHFISARSKGFVASENRLLQGLGLLQCARNNKRNRANLAQHVERVIFQPADSQLTIRDPFDFHTERVVLSRDNVFDAILASGSLPLIMQGIRDISGAPTGIYRDGGIIDYHFDFNIQNEGLILYPHFSALLRSGWFDKKLLRRVSAEHYERVVLLCPSDQFIAALPYGKIPDRSDFNTLEDSDRMAYWRSVTGQSERLSEEFSALSRAQDLSCIRPISELVG